MAMDGADYTIIEEIKKSIDENINVLKQLLEEQKCTNELLRTIVHNTQPRFLS